LNKIGFYPHIEGKQKIEVERKSEKVTFVRKNCFSSLGVLWGLRVGIDCVFGVSELKLGVGIDLVS
jgi:hypothetical protein